MGIVVFLILVMFSAQGQTSQSPQLTLPKEKDVLSGSCVLIPCTLYGVDFQTNKSHGSIRAIWIKGGAWDLKLAVFNSSENTTKGLERIEMLGDLHKGNCTTIFYNIQTNQADKYFFRIESSGFKATFAENPIEFKVKDSPVSPQVPQVDLSEVSEGSSVNLTCTAAAPCTHKAPTITWSLPAGQITTEIRDNQGRKSLVSILTLTANRRHHGKEISCMVSYLSERQIQRNSPVKTLRVLFSPAVISVSVSPSGPVVEGNSVTLTCNSSEANPPVQNYTWFRRNQNSTRGSGQTLTFNVSSSDEGLYYCRAEHPQGAKESTVVKLVIKGTSPQTQLTKIVGGFLGGVLFCALIGLALRLKKSKTDEQCSQHQDSGACVPDACKDESIHTNCPKPSEDLEEQIHYGEIDFSKRPRSNRKMTGQEQDSEYAELHLSCRDAQVTYYKAPDTEELYAQVK